MSDEFEVSNEELYRECVRAQAFALVSASMVMVPISIGLLELGAVAGGGMGLGGAIVTYLMGYRLVRGDTDRLGRVTGRILFRSDGDRNLSVKEADERIGERPEEVAD